MVYCGLSVVRFSTEAMYLIVFVFCTLLLVSTAQNIPNPYVAGPPPGGPSPGSGVPVGSAPSGGSCPTNQPSCQNAKVRSMAPFREDDTEPGSILTTNTGVKIPNDRDSLKAGTRGPTILEDFHMREKITHFDHERIPERVVHARGSAAHGYFQLYESLANITKAKFLADPSLITPVYVRFSTVVGFRGSADTVRDIRGFATKFYTVEGNYDLVANNAPVFFMQDAIKFPDFVHAIKPEPHNEMPQAQSAHDTFFDWVTQQTESQHAVMWVMSDRSIPRSYANIEGFGVHTFRLINAQGVSRFVKFHWKPKAGLKSLVWDEAQKIAGKDPDFHRRLLYDDIEMSNYLEFELGLQIIEEADVDKLGFDLLDATKLIPEEIIPVMRVGKMVLNRNPDNFFAETEQVAYHTGNVVPGIDFTNDPLLQGRLFSYLDTQLFRLGGVNFHEIPINRPLCPLKNNQRDGFHRDTINLAKTSYHINAINNGLPVEATPEEGFTSYPQLMYGPKTRQRSSTFGDHYSQATLFYESNSPPEQEHIINAYSFELSKCNYPIMRSRMVSMLRSVNETLAERVAANLNITLPPKADENYPKPVQISPALTILNDKRPSIKAMRVAILVMEGVNGDTVAQMKTALMAANATVRIIAPRIGILTVGQGAGVVADGSIEANPSVLFDATFIAGGTSGDILNMQNNGKAVHYAYETYAHFKSLAASGSSVGFLKSLGLIDSSQPLPEGVTVSESDVLSSDFIEQFKANIANYRFFNRREVAMVPV